MSDLREDWMEHADAVLADEAIVVGGVRGFGESDIRRAVARGRHGTPAEVVLRLLILKHVRNWSYEVLEREVRANLVYRGLHPRGRRQDAGRQDDRAAGASRSDPRCSSRFTSGVVQIAKREGRDCRTSNACGYDGGGDRYPSPDRQHLAGRRRPRADAHHAQDHARSRAQPERSCATAAEV